MEGYMETNFLIVIGALLLGGFSKGVTGMGLPILIIPILASFWDMKTAVIVASIPVTLSNFSFIGIYREAWPEMKQFKSFIIVGLLFVFVGVFLLAVIDQGTASLALGFIAIMFVLFNLFYKQITIPDKYLPVAAPVFGALSGVFQGVTGICGPIVVAYLTSIKDISRSLYFHAIGIFFTLFGAFQIIGYLIGKMFTFEIFKLSILISIPIFLGFFIGTKIQKFLPQRLFKHAILLLILISGLNLIIKNYGILIK